MCRWLLGALLVFGACKKESATSGLPPAPDWKGGQPPSGEPAPSTGSAMPNDSIHGGGAASGSAMPNDSIHGGLPPAGGSAMPNDSIHSGLPPAGGATPAKTPPQTLEKLADGRVGLGPFSVVIPKEWTEKPTTSSMRAAQLVLSTTPKEEAELIVYYFGDAGAGSVQDNLDRWLGQFQQADGKPSKDVAKIEKATFAGQSATVVSVTGHYTAMAMGGGADAVDKSDQSLLAAIIDSPQGPYYFKLVGAKKTVDAHAARFRAMLASLKLR